MIFIKFDYNLTDEIENELACIKSQWSEKGLGWLAGQLVDIQRQIVGK